jgi:hypothetical protein
MTRPADPSEGHSGDDYEPPDGREQAASFAQYVQRLSTETYPTGVMRRSVQSKNHGAVRAEFVIEDDLAPQLRVGLFAQPGNYSAWIRFANQASPPRSDRKRDIRGMSIKVCGVRGVKLHDEPPGAETADFLLISTNVFVTANAEDFFRLRRATQPRSIPNIFAFFFNPRRLQLRTIKNILLGFQKCANPLEQRYFSATPYRFGSTAAKYSAIPRQTGSPIPRKPADDFLREAMAATLRDGTAEFDFAVQLQTDDNTTPIEDAGKAWDERRAPFTKVATIRIPSQVFDSPQQMEFCENLAFNPWRTLEDHRPIGGVNRARREIYPPLAAQRHSRNAAPLEEPTGKEAF